MKEEKKRTDRGKERERRERERKKKRAAYCSELVEVRGQLAQPLWLDGRHVPHVLLGSLSHLDKHDPANKTPEHAQRRSLSHVASCRNIRVC